VSFSTAVGQYHKKRIWFIANHTRNTAQLTQACMSNANLWNFQYKLPADIIFIIFDAAQGWWLRAYGESGSELFPECAWCMPLHVLESVGWLDAIAVMLNRNVVTSLGSSPVSSFGFVKTMYATTGTHIYLYTYSHETCFCEYAYSFSEKMKWLPTEDLKLCLFGTGFYYSQLWNMQERTDRTQSCSD
jgi:hypothetical protein